MNLQRYHEQNRMAKHNPPPEPISLSIDQMKRGKARIEKRIEELEAFNPMSVSKRWGPEVGALQVAIKDTLGAIFGDHTVKYNRYAGAATLDHGPINAGRTASPMEIYRYLDEGKESALSLLRQAVRSLEEEIQDKEEPSAQPGQEVSSVSREAKGQIFIGHGRSLVWHQLKSFLSERLHLPCNEFNAEAVAGRTTTERQQLLDEATFAFLVMTAEDTHADNSTHPRENVIHEAGLFQGRLGFERAIILLEEGCAQFSNIHGLTYIGFPNGNLEPAFEKIRQVLEREQVVT